MLEDICRQAEQAAEELIEKAKLHPGQIVVIGCSTSEICGSRIGSDSRPEVAEQVFAVLHRVLTAHGLYLAAQCCEHLNRAIIIEREAVPGADIVNVVPQPKAGGSFATAAYHAFRDPVAVESELTGMEGTTTVFRVEPARITLQRSGTLESQMVFELGHEDRSLYDMGFGALMITVLTDRLENTLTDAGGEMDVSYSVAIENETAGHIDYHIHVRPQEA